MSDIKKGYTFTDKSTDWASNKETAIRLNKMMDEAKVNLVAGTNVTITPTINGPLIDVAGSGSGDVVGPASATDNALARFDGTTGKLIQNSVVTVDDTTGNMAGVGTLTVGGALTYGGVTLTNNVTGTGKMVLDSSPILVTPNLGTPSTLVGTNITGTASNLTAGTVTTNANLTGEVTSVGNATTIAADAVTNAKLADMIANTVKVNATASTANPTDLSIGTNTVLGRVAGDIVAAQVVTDQITDNAVTFAKLQDGVANTVLARAAATNGDVAGVALAASQLLGRGSTGDISAITLGTNLSITGTTLNAAGGGGGGGTVTSVSVVAANGFDGTITNPTINPAITLSTTVTGLVKGNGTTLSAATAGSDYQAPITLTTTGTSGAATFISNTLNIPQYSGGGGSGTVTSVSVVTANGVSGSVANSTTTPAITLTLGDISAASSKPSGGTARSFTSRNGDVFNVRDYGALGDGSTDDITAIGNALDAAITARGKLYFPAGVYVISNTINKTFGAVGTFYGLSIYGDGIGCSIIKQTTSNRGVFDLICAGRSGCLTIENLGFWNNSGLSTVPCIKYAVSQEDNNDSHPNMRATNLFFGAQSGGNSWTIGMDLYNIHNGYISGVQYYGDLAGGGTGIVFQKYGTNATAGTNKSMACCIQGSQFNLCNTGIKIKDSMESCLIQECLMVGVVYGVNSDYSIHLGVVNSHINCNGTGTGVCIYGSGTGSDSGRLDQFVCQGNLLYSQDANSTGINAGLNRSTINGNSFVSPMNSNGTKGIIITGGEGNNISGNSFSWHKVSYIEIASNYSLVSSNNATKGSALATNQYVNTGTGNNLVNNYYQT
jgi:hypothetical protein